MTRYLVTGGAGFIGSHITRALLDAGHEVVVLDDLSSGRRENLDEASDGAPPGRFRFVHGSILDDAAVDDAVAGVEAVFHEAAIPSVPRSLAEPIPSLRTNVEGTARLLEACRGEGVGALVFASSSSVYGDTERLPKDESMPTRPLSPYALSKLSGEWLCDIYARAHGLRTVALRYFNVFGPRQDPGSQYAAVVPNFISRMLLGEAPRIYGDGNQSRDFTFVDNVVAANFLAAGLTPPGAAGHGTPGAGADDAGLEGTAPEGAGVAALDGSTWSGPQDGCLVVNIGVGARTTVLDLVAAINEILGTEIAAEHAEPRPGDVRHSHAAIEEARRHLGYRPLVSLDQGLRRTVTWFRERSSGGR